MGLIFTWWYLYLDLYLSSLEKGSHRGLFSRIKDVTSCAFFQKWVTGMVAETLDGVDEGPPDDIWFGKNGGAGGYLASSLA